MNIKCNICGGDVSLSADKTFATCEYCGSTITVPKVSDEQRAAAFNRGNDFRRAGEFDNALASYERILRDDDTDAEAHWCAALCRFGIEYVEDPATYEWIPTCHRASFDSFTEDVDFKAALEYSDGLTRRLYQKEAAKIAEVQKGILATSRNEEPYDVFICFKDKGEDGQRTRDSILAQDIYYQLTDQGHRVFFSRITLEGKGGAEYEPYIFAALNSAKVMVAVGTKPEHFSAVWVRNEWSRFLALMRKDRSKTLLPCYRDMDPYHLPEQLKILQSYDMGKIGFIQDLIHGVDKVVRAEKKPTAPAETVVVQQSGATNVTALVKRGYMALEDGDWKQADDFFEQALNQNAELAEAYLGKFLAEQQVMDLDTFVQAYLHRTENVKPVYKDACEKNLLVESDAVNMYTISGCLDEAYIRDEFKIGRSFESTADSRGEQLKQTQKLVHSDKNLRRAIKFGDEEERQHITAALDQLISLMQERLEQAVYSDERKREEAQENYMNACNLAMKRISDEYNGQMKRIADEKNAINAIIYAEASDLLSKAIPICSSSATTYKLQEAITMLSSASDKFTSLQDYEDSQWNLGRCRSYLCMTNWKLQDRCQYCGGKFEGFFTVRCAKCGKKRDY